MAASKTDTGCKEQLQMEVSRCLRMRFSESRCQLCAEICPHGTVKLDAGLAVNADLCRGCMLCTAVCPVGALEARIDFAACLERLSKASEPVLGCVRTKEHSNAAVACFGGLSPEHLLLLFHSLAGRVTLNLFLCSDCPNSAMLASLHQRLSALSDAGVTEGGCRIMLAESASDVRYCDISIDRRGFFKSFRDALFTSAATILSPENGEFGKHREYSAKRLPIRRELLNLVRRTLSPEVQTRLCNYLDFNIIFDKNCTRCQGCVAICPTGALQTSFADDQPLFDQRSCTGCGLCVEFCLDKALRLEPCK